MFQKPSALTKTKLMVFGSRQLLPRLQDFSVSLLAKDIFATQTAKDVGMTLDPYLSYDEHIINTAGAPNETIVQNHLNIVLLNVF